MALGTHWSDRTWRTLRIATFVTSGVTLVLLLVIMLTGSSSWRYPLVVVVVINLLAFSLLMLRTMSLQTKDDPATSVERTVSSVRSRSGNVG